MKLCVYHVVVLPCRYMCDFFLVIAVVQMYGGGLCQDHRRVPEILVKQIKNITALFAELISICIDIY